MFPMDISPYFMMSVLAVSPLVDILPCCAKKSNSSPVICHTGLPSNSFIVIIRLF